MRRLCRGGCRRCAKTRGRISLRSGSRCRTKSEMPASERRYVHGYDPLESTRLQDQATTLLDLLHADTSYPAGSSVLEVGCGVGAQTITLARNSPDAKITSIDVSAASLEQARAAIEAAGLKNV